MSTTWLETVRPLVRNIIGDFIEPYTYDDDRLNSLCTSGAALVCQDMYFNNQYVINIVTYDITPDPVEAGDDTFVALVAYKTACLIVGGEQRGASDSAVSVQDGPSSINMGGVATSKAKLTETICDQYTNLLNSARMSGGNMAGEAIVGPYNSGDTSSGRGVFR